MGEKFELTRSVLNILAISGTSGSSGLGSQSREQIDSNTEKTKEKPLLNCYLLTNLVYIHHSTSDEVLRLIRRSSVQYECTVITKEFCEN